jgi:hypothetical protein
MKQFKTEQIEALFASPEMGQKAVLLAGQKIFRANAGGYRYYIDTTGKSFMSVTSFLSATQPEGRHLKNFRSQMAAELGSSEAMESYVQSTADYGTALHIAVSDFVRNGKIDWLAFEDWAYMYISETVTTKRDIVYQAVIELVNDTAALLKFLFDYRCNVLAVELPVFYNVGTGGIATCIDLVVEMDVKHYDKTPVEQRKRHKAIINIKSGKKGFYETHLQQLALEREAYNDTYGSITGKIEAAYNVAPNDWKTTPTYKLKDWTEQLDETYKLLYFDIQKADAKGILKAPERKENRFIGTTAYGQDPTEAMKANNLLDWILEQQQTQK